MSVVALQFVFLSPLSCTGPVLRLCHTNCKQPWKYHRYVCQLFADFQRMWVLSLLSKRFMQSTARRQMAPPNIFVRLPFPSDAASTSFVRHSMWSVLAYPSRAYGEQAHRSGWWRKTLLRLSCNLLCGQSLQQVAHRRWKWCDAHLAGGSVVM
jgi:hypothetical protein